MKGRHIIPLAATAALAAGATLAGAPAAHADWEGTITGKVVNADGTPARYVEVDAAGADGSTPSDYTDRNGVYRIEVSVNEAYTLTLNGESSVPAQVAGGAVGAVTPGPTFTLPPVTLSAPPTTFAAVVSVVGGSPVDTYVSAYNAATNQRVDETTASTDGRYYFSDLPAGSYKIQATNDKGQIWSGGKLNLRDATPMAVGSGTDLGSLTLPADQADGSVTGHITVPRVAGFDEWYGSVEIVDANGSYAGGAETDAAGNFSADVAPGTYYAAASGGADQVSNFASVVNGTSDSLTPRGQTVITRYSTAVSWYGGKTFALAKKIVVKPNGTVSGVNFNLSKTLQPINKPMIKGKFKKGKKISVTTGDWNQPNGVLFSYVWKEGSKVLGTSSHLKLTKKVWRKVRKLNVVVTAYDKSGSLYTGTVKLRVAKTVKAQVRAAKKQLRKDQKQDNKAIKQAGKV